jgi:hypothetical protein
MSDEYASNNINLEIYEYLLNDYSNDPESPLKYITTNIESSETEECEYIGVRDLLNNPHKKKISFGEKKRSCDVIKGILDVVSNADADLQRYMPLQNINMTDIDFELFGITSRDLVNFTFNYPSKMKSRRDVINPTSSQSQINKIGSVTQLYIPTFINEIIKSLNAILVEEWKIAICDYNKNLKKDGDHDEYNYNDAQVLKYSQTHKMIKIIKPNAEDKFIVIGDVHGSFATLVRILLRLRKKNILNEHCVLNDNYNIIFLGDLVDRGIYGYEVIMILFLLKLKNPNNVFLNNGNHEDKLINSKNDESLWNQISIQFEIDVATIIFNNINLLFNIGHCAILIKNPTVENKYIYLAHGGLPTSVENGHLIDNFSYVYFNNMSYYLVDNKLISKYFPHMRQYVNDTIRWSDWGNKDVATLENSRGGKSYVFGKNILDQVRLLGIDMVIRGHQDDGYNTKIIMRDPVNEFDFELGIDLENIKNIVPDYEPDNQICKDHIYLINQLNNGSILLNNKLEEQMLPVITLSTNTDYGRDLYYDSFAILKFTQSELPNCKNELEKNMRTKYLKYKNKYLKLKQQFEKK